MFVEIIRFLEFNKIISLIEYDHRSDCLSEALSLSVSADISLCLF